MSNKIYLGIPTAQDCLIHSKVSDHANYLLYNNKVSIYKTIPNDDVKIGRNIAAKETIISGSSHLAFLDTDTLPINKDWIEKLLSHNKDVICGITPVYLNGNIFWNVRKTKQRMRLSEIKNFNELIKINYMGGTTCLIKKEVLESIDWPYFDSKIGDINQKTGEIELMSEDYYFSEKIRKAGFKIYADTSILCNHFCGKINILPTSLQGIK